jgi:hypothetical protein
MIPYFNLSYLGAANRELDAGEKPHQSTGGTGKGRIPRGTILEDSLGLPTARHDSSSELQLQLRRPIAQSAALAALCRLIHPHQGIYEALHSLIIENYGLTLEGA